MAAISPDQKKHAIVLAGSLVAILGLCWLMKLSFEHPTTALKTELSTETQFFTMEDGAAFNGEGLLQIGTDNDKEVISFARVTGEPKKEGDVPAGFPVGKGSALRDHPNTFKVVARGLENTEIRSHSAGTEVATFGDSLFFPRNNASFGEEVDSLFYLILWITGIAFILTEAFFLFCVVSFWDRPGRRAHYSHGNHKFELGATLVVVLVLVMLALWQNNMWTAMKQSMPISYAGVEDFETQEKNERPVHWQVVALRFKWYFRHPGLDGAFGTGDDIAYNEMIVPKGRDVLFHLRSQDVLHSFFLPHYRVKQDVVVGRMIPGWFRAERTGDFPIMCAELCGEGHTTMGARLKVQTNEEYQNWVREFSAEAAESNYGGDPSDPDYDPADAEERPLWYGVDAKYWWWWDQNPIRAGYAEDFVSK